MGKILIWVKVVAGVNHSGFTTLHLRMWWLTGGAPDFWGKSPPGSTPASPTMILMRCRIIVYSNKVDNLRVDRDTHTPCYTWVCTVLT